MPRLTVSIVNYNTRDELRRCLASLHSAGVSDDVEVFVVDNASSDGSARMVEADFPWVRLIALTENVGFAGGNNRVLETSASDYFLILNPDVEGNGAALIELLDFLECTPEAAAVSPLLTGLDGRAQTHLYRRFPSRAQIALFWTVLAPLARRMAPLRHRWFEHDLRGREPVAVDQLPGAALLVRRSALERVGGLDPDYFIWFEDVDWCYRARRAGFLLYVLPEVRMRHEGGASFASWRLSTRVRQFYRAFALFVCKHGLDGLRRFAVPVLTLDLLVKDVALRLGRAFRWPGMDQAVTFRPTRRALRDVVVRWEAGENVKLGDPAAPVDSVKIVRAKAANALHRGRSAVDAIVVNWNGRRYLPQCLDALGRSTEPVDITVVDNGSSDGSLEYLRAARPGVDLVDLGRNVGYAAGANAGLRATGNEYAIVLNPDVALAPDHLAILKLRLNQDEVVGAAQGKLYQIARDDFLERRFTSSGAIDSAGHVIRRSRMVHDRGQGRSDDPAFATEASVFSACGAALFLRRAMLDDLAPEGEYFDESFFAYKEDIDLCWRARWLGWDVRYIPSAVGYHVRSWDGRRVPNKDRISAAARRHSWKNHYLLMLKNDRMADVLRSLPAIGAWEFVRQGHAVLRDPRIYRAYADLIRLVPDALRKRREIMHRRRVPPAAIRRWFGAEPEVLEDRESAATAVRS